MKSPSQSSSPFPLMKSRGPLIRAHNLRLLPMLASAASVLLCSPLARGAASYPATVLADGPVAYYRLEETSGTTGTPAADSSGNGRDGTYNFSTGGSPHLGLPGITTNSIFYDAVGADYGYVDA